MQNIRNSHNYDGSQGWGQAQPLKLDSVEEYIEAAYERRRAFRSIIEEFRQAAGCGEIVAPCIKSEDSATRKLWDRTSSSFGRPDMIGDYLRARLLVPANPGSLAQLTRTMDKFIDHPLTVGFKDRLFRPNGSGFRALNGHMMVDGMIAELQIIPDDRLGVTREVNKVTEALRSSERAVREAEERFDMNSGGVDMIRRMFKLVTKAENSICLFREMRSDLHQRAAVYSGVNALMDPAIAHKHTLPDHKKTQKLYSSMLRDYFARTAAVRIEEPMRFIFSLPPPSPMPHHMTLQ